MPEGDVVTQRKMLVNSIAYRIENQSSVEEGDSCPFDWITEKAV